MTMGTVDRHGWKAVLRSSARRLLLLVSLAAILLMFVRLPPAEAHQVEKDSPTRLPEPMEQSTAPVTLDGRVLFPVRGITAYPAEQRAQVLSARIEALAADPDFDAESLRLEEAGDHTAIVSGDTAVVNVFDLDADTEGVGRQALAQVYRGKIAEAIRIYRADRDPGRLLIHTGYATGAILLLVLLLVLVSRASRWLEKAIERRFKARIQDVRIQSFQLLQAEKLWAGVRSVVRTLRALTMLTLLLVCLDFVLSLYPWTRPIAVRGLTLLLDPLRTIAWGVLGAVPNLLFIAILALVVRYALKLTRLFFSGIDSGTVEISGFDREWAWPTYKIVRLLTVAFALVVAYPYIPGAESAAFKGVSIFLGIVFSLGSSSAVANIIAGYTMTYRRAFRMGDRVRIGDVVGDVVGIRLQVTHLRSLKNEEVVVPNSMILNGHVINYSSMARRHGLILHTTVGIGYETPWRQVEAMLLLAAARTDGLLKEPPPFVLQQALGDFCVTYELNVATDRAQDSPRLYTDLHRNILDVFNEYGVQIMTPAYMADPAQAKVVPGDRWFDAPAAAPPLPAADSGQPEAQTTPG